MQDELKNAISQAMNTSENSKQELSEQVAKGELSDEALEAVAGGWTIPICKFKTWIYPKAKS